MAKLLIQTQVQENYGAHDWDGKGSCPQYWKFKGGSEYVVKNFRGFGEITETVMALRGQIESDSEYFREYIINFEVVADDYLTDSERSQLEWDGEILYPAQELTIS